MTLDEINKQIAKLMQEKAEDQALAHYVAPRASSRLDYIVNGDRSGLDKFDASEQAYATMLAKQRMSDDEAYRQRMFNELSKEADRLNAIKIASMNRTDANIAKLDAVEKELNSLLITKQTLDAQGKDSREVTARIEQIYKRYPEIERPQLPEYDPETDVNYVLAKSGLMNYMDNAGKNELEDMLSTVKNYRTPEAAKERVRLEREIVKRDKAAQFKEQLDKDIANYWKTGVMSDLMLQLGFEEAGVAGNRHLLQGKKIHRRPKKNGAPATPTKFQTT